jgi:replicative superfamily II helicase
LLAKWLNDAKFYVSKYRPVPVEEHLVFDNAVYPASTSSAFMKTATQIHDQTQTQTQSILQQRLEPMRTIESSPDKELSSPLINAIVALANETVRAGYGVLVFCSSRVGCERDAVVLSQVLPRGQEVDPLVMERRRDLLDDLRSTATGLDSILEKTILVGVAFHRE